MENTEDNPHLNIETVTPDTEKDGQPNDQKNNHRINNEGDKAQDRNTEPDQPEGTGEKDPYALYEKTDNESTNNQDNTKAEDSDSDIETVAP